MAKRTVSRVEIHRLAARLTTLEQVLSEGERSLLRAIFDMALEVAQPIPEAQADRPHGGKGAGCAGAADGPAGAERPRLTEGFEGAFQPGRAAGFTLDGPGAAAGEPGGPGIRVRLV
jgi:hypothetical protein